MLANGRWDLIPIRLLRLHLYHSHICSEVRIANLPVTLFSSNSCYFQASFSATVGLYSSFNATNRPQRVPLETCLIRQGRLTAVPHQAMKAYWRNRYIPPLIPNVIKRWGEWSTSRPGRFIPSHSPPKNENSMSGSAGTQKKTAKREF
jgi:hypothetical protein